MGTMFSDKIYEGDEVEFSNFTSRSRLLLDQKTPAEREHIKRARRKMWRIIWGTLLLLFIMGAVAIYLYYKYIMTSYPAWTLDDIKLLPGFKIEHYIKQDQDAINKIIKPRSLHVSSYKDSTIVYVGTATPFVYALIDIDSDGINDEIFRIWQSTDAYGAFSITVNEEQETLYISDMSGKIYCCPFVHHQVFNLQNDTQRLHNCSLWLTVPNAHYMAINPADNNLCIAFGVTSSITLREHDSVQGTIRCFNGYDVDSINDSTVYAYGVRHSVGFEFHPTVHQQLWFTDRGVEGISDDFPDDELNNVRHIGQHFGFPYCHTIGYGSVYQRNVGESQNSVDEIFGEYVNDTCSAHEYIPAHQPLGPHVGSSGMKFIFSTKQGSLSNRFILIAQHGSNDREPLIGYRVMMIELKGDNFEEISAYKPFADGWMDEETQMFYGRPVDIEWLKHDDSFLISDDFADAIYRIYYDAYDCMKDVVNCAS